MLSADTWAQLVLGIAAAIIATIAVWLSVRYPGWRDNKKKHNKDLLINVINPLMQMYTRFDDEDGIRIYTFYQNNEHEIFDLNGWDNFYTHIRSRPYRNIKKAFNDMNATIKDHNDKMPKLRDETLALIEQNIHPQEDMEFLPHGIFNGLYRSMIDGSVFSRQIHATIGTEWRATYETLSRQSWTVAQSRIIQTADESHDQRIQRVCHHIESSMPTIDVSERIQLLIEMRRAVDLRIKMLVQELIPLQKHIHEGGFIKGKCGVEKNM